MQEEELQKRAEFFVLAWQESVSGRNAAAVIGMTYAACKSKASWYRRNGVPLKFHGRKHIEYSPRRRIDFDKLRRIAENYNEENNDV